MINVRKVSSTLSNYDYNLNMDGIFHEYIKKWNFQSVVKNIISKKHDETDNIEIKKSLVSIIIVCDTYIKKYIIFNFILPSVPT